MQADSLEEDKNLPSMKRSGEDCSWLMWPMMKTRTAQENSNNRAADKESEDEDEQVMVADRLLVQIWSHLR